MGTLGQCELAARRQVRRPLIVLISNFDEKLLGLESKSLDDVVPRQILVREKALFLGLGRELVTGDNTDAAELFTGSVFARDAKERAGPYGYAVGAGTTRAWRCALWCCTKLAASGRVSLCYPCRACSICIARQGTVSGQTRLQKV